MSAINSSIKDITMPSAKLAEPIRIIQPGARKPLTDKSPVADRNTKVTSTLVKLKPRAIKISKLQDIL